MVVVSRTVFVVIVRIAVVVAGTIEVEDKAAVRKASIEMEVVGMVGVAACSLVETEAILD